MGRFTDKVALVTGAAAKRGMGRSIALGLAKEGADIVLVDKFQNPPSLFSGDEGWGGLEEEIREVQSLGRQAISELADISDSGSINRAVDSALKKFGRIDILINCAGIVGKRETPVVDLTENDWQFVLDVNLRGAFLISKAVARDMVGRGQGGKIIHISSSSGKQGVAGVAPYSAAKFALIGLVQSLALELAPHKINVNAVCPGYIITNLRDDWFKDKARDLGVSIESAKGDRYKEKSAVIPLGRMGTVEDVRDVVLFLVSNEADYVTGQSLNITGGIIMH